MAGTPLSPSALNRWLGCEQHEHYELLAKRGEPVAERRPPAMELVLERGQRFEEGVIDEMREEGREIVTVSEGTPADRAARTLEAMRAGVEVVYQGCLLRDGWVGYPDFLIRTEVPSSLGAFSYEVHDAKLSQHARPSHVFQVLFYTDELERLQGVRPLRMHLLLGDGTHPSFAPDDYEAYAAIVRASFAARRAELEAGAQPAYPYPVRSCDFCDWWHVCRGRWRADDHLSLVAGLQQEQGRKLEAAGISTLVGLAELPAETVVPRLSGETLKRLRRQADIQRRSRGLERPLYEVLEPTFGRGLGRLPAPSAGDVHFDFEGDPYWGEDGLEYLFGSRYVEGGETRYWPLWALSRAEEKQALETWIDWLRARLEVHPDLHVLHYNNYETTALKRLVARHATREAELDDLLRREVFVDLYAVVRQAIRAGTERYGLKALEPLIGFERGADREVAEAIGSLARWQAYGEDGDREHLEQIARYNADDCAATDALLAWLLARRPEAEAQFGIELGTLAPEPARDPSERALQLARWTEELRGPLLDGLPDDEALDTAEQRARRLAFALTGYHAREAKPGWWAYFERRKRTLEQLRDEDAEALSDLEIVSTEPRASDRKPFVWTLSWPPQDHKLSPGRADEPLCERAVEVVAVDDAARTITVRRSAAAGDVPPRAVGPGGPFNVDAQVDAVFAFARRVADSGLERPEAALDLLLRRTPRLKPGTPPLGAGEHDFERLRSQVLGLDRSALVVQGPPGTGKTYTGARIATELMRAGRRVGVMATSHKAIDNLVAAIDEAADAEDLDFRGWRKPPSSGTEDTYRSDRVSCAKRLPEPDDEDGREVLLHAATAWHWAREDVAGSVDVLLVDEAGQVSLADAIAVAQGATNVVLLGDPQQLAHVSQGTHALGSGASVLAHLLDGADTVPRERGAFLAESWRMHPAICDFLSGAMYDGRLTARAGCERQRIEAPGLHGSGLRMVGVEHLDNRTSSVEEAAAVAREVEQLLDGGSYVDRDGKRHALTLEDVLVVAPYNAQVRCLRAHLPDGARVGTVDKFQGQEAPVVVFSMASSSGEDVSRGLGFLFSRNRLNVALSRAQALAIVVCEPTLLRARCATVEDMALVNMLCRVAEAAGQTDELLAVSG